jgi:NTE family protein
MAGMAKPIRVALALGGGGARGYAHIGVIQVLHERGYEIVGVAGSSMGALVAGMHASGALPEYAEWALGLTRLQVIRMLGISLAPGGAFSADRVLDRMSQMLAGARIEDLGIPFTAVATDLLARKPVWFESGPVDAAIRASIAIPGFFAPVVVNGRVLVDGGIIDPVPMTPLASVQSDLTIAVSLSGDKAPAEASRNPSTDHEQSVDELAGVAHRGTVNLKDSKLAHTWKEHFGVPDEQATGLSSLEVLNLSYDAMQDVITRYRLAGYPPDVLVQVPKDACGMLDFHRAADLIALGRHLMEAALATAPAKA